VSELNIETPEDLKKVLRELGYSNPAIAGIMKWYVSEDNSEKPSKLKNSSS
jgi:hypothetical protein